MEIKFSVPEDKVKYFSGNAKTRVVETCKNYTLELISEAERIELATHEDGSPSEITSSHVSQAAKKFRPFSIVKRQKIGSTVLKIISDVLIFCTGIMFLPDQFVKNNSFNIAYFVFFLLMLSAAIITTVVSQFLGGE